MEDDTGFTGPPKGNALVALHRCVQGCASQPFQPAFPGQSQFPGQVVQVALQAIPPIGKKENTIKHALHFKKRKTVNQFPQDSNSVLETVIHY